ncbi:plasmid mobilization relaxosome protein MobC [Pelotomaculum terephthalicicum JT]|uniref:plasmid mobilization protein n=1 Tax=Pelotomaculum TaxID=191373 RepID=UPI0009C47FC1|nr:MULTISPECIES: plasmid mobilization relaxosome protein MobC [Pelotomaculum]MCG9969905.1 plasmid mobilization relaxosome protein MobC [Pelotomaculum terephthalicicum JT]OPX84834.1 MAG: hypothetical protein A4E54_02753 [Pelotomaculum sp. PtaB.Bin117]OPY59858.1 MAG: hypothetical protein A4E56_03053 [Pelotomaculum sp. PtaU1.Bin065]
MRKHNNTFHIRFTEQEYEKLCAMSVKTGLPKSTCIRFLISGLVPKDRPSPDYYAMTKQLYRIGNLLNQIAARAHATGHIDSKRLEATTKRSAESSGHNRYARTNGHQRGYPRG